MTDKFTLKDSTITREELAKKIRGDTMIDNRWTWWELIKALAVGLPKLVMFPFMALIYVMLGIGNKALGERFGNWMHKFLTGEEYEGK